MDRVYHVYLRTWDASGFTNFVRIHPDDAKRIFGHIMQEMEQKNVQDRNVLFNGFQWWIASREI